MAQLIKLESGSYLNLDAVQFIYLVKSGENKDRWKALHNNTDFTWLSPKDLEKIDQIAELNENQTTPPVSLTTEQLEYFFDGRHYPPAPS